MLPKTLGQPATALPGIVGVVLSTAVSPWVFTADVLSDEPLHRRIDQSVVSGNVADVAPVAGDLEFLRRIYLDLNGRIPSSDEARAFLKESDPDKRTRKVNELLAGREFVLHMAETLDIWFMERRGDLHVKTADWRRFLIEALQSNKPYHVLVEEILHNDGSDEKTRAAARFYLDRVGEPHVITRDVGRIFFGIDLQCAQCHDHPNIDDYLQRDYYGLFAFFNRTSLFQPDTKKPAALSEKAEGEATFESVFTKVKGKGLPRVPLGDAVADPETERGKYKVAPNPKDGNVRPVPAYSRREQLAKVLKNGEANMAFNLNIANRLWAHMMGRGLVEPVDFHHSKNPASHPELLDLLARTFAADGYDIRAFLKEVALTQTYQRTFEMPAALASQAKAIAPRISALEGEVASLLRAVGKASDAWEQEKELWQKASLDFDEKFGAKLAEVEKKHTEARTADKKAREALAKVKESLEKGRKALVALEASVHSAQEAADLLPDDKEFADAVAKISKRRDEVSGSVKKDAESLSSHEKEVTTAREAVAAADKDMAAVHAVADVEKTKVDALENRFTAAHERHVAERSALESSQRLLDDARELVAYAALQDEHQVIGQGARKVAETTGQLLASFREAETRVLNLALAAHRAHEALETSRDSDLADAVALLRTRRDAARDEFYQSAEAIAEQLVRSDEARERERKIAEQADAALESLSERWTNAFAVGVFAPLSPEQLCMSTARATGQWERVRANGEAEFTKKLEEQRKAEEASAEKAEPAKEKEEKKEGEKKKDTPPPPPPLKPEERGPYVENYLRENLKGAQQRYVKLFGGQEGQPQTDFYATADQALFLANDGLVRGWLSPGAGNLVDRLQKLNEPAELAEELYLSVLTREPESAEKQQVTSYLASRPNDRNDAIQELAWALLSSVEFRFRH
jgi:hypothetical protein